MSEEEDPNGRIRTPISPATWTGDEAPPPEAAPEAAPEAQPPSGRPATPTAEPKAEPRKKAG